MAVSPGGSPALATAGTGDVLSGLVGALLAKGLGPFEAAALGALAHGLAGRAAAERLGADHVMAGDVIDALPSRADPVTAPERALARIDGGAIERNCRRLLELTAEAPGLAGCAPMVSRTALSSARWSRPTATGTGPPRRPGRR